MVVGGACIYVFGNISSTFLGEPSPSAEKQSTWCNLFSFLCKPIIGESTFANVSIDTNLGARPVGKNIVYFQFAGDLNRKSDIIPFLVKLKKYNWNGQGFDKGGKRTEYARGYNEIRYFYPEDKDNAERLANAIKKAHPPKGSGQNLEIKLLNPAEFNNPERGKLEIWISN